MNNSNTIQQTSALRFALGQTYIMPGAEEALMIVGQTAIEFLRRHTRCDFGALENDDIRENELSLREGFRVMSVYSKSRGQRLWIISETDRS